MRDNLFEMSKKRKVVVEEFGLSRKQNDILEDFWARDGLFFNRGV